MHGVYTHSTFTNSWGNLTLNNSVLNSRSKSELTNHLGNVLSVISDKPIPHSNSGGLIDYWLADILVSQDYSPFGVTLSGRNFDLLTTHQNTGGTTTPPPTVAEIYKNDFDTPPATTNPYTGTPTIDDKIISSSWSTPTAGGFTNFNGKTGKAIAITTATPDTSYITLTLTVKDSAELTLDSYSFYHRSSGTGYANYILAVNGANASSGAIWVSNNNNLHTTGDVSLSNISGLTGTVQVTLKLFGGTHGAGGTFRMDDFVLNGYMVQNVQNSGGEIARNGYKYGFNGQEKDNQVSGNGNSYSAEFWQYSSRLGKRWNLDPRPNVSISPYATFGNNPILFSDVKGDTITDPKSRAHFDNLVSQTKGKIQEYNRKLKDIAFSTDMSSSEKQKEYAHYSFAKGEMENALLEYDEMLHTQDFNYNISVDQNISKEANGETILAEDGYNINIKFRGNSATLSHEMKHGYDYISGNLDGSSLTYDLNDEVAAHTRAMAFDRNHYSGVKYVWDITPDFVKHRGNSYKNLPGINLSTNSPVFSLYGYNDLKEELLNRIRPYKGLNMLSDDRILDRVRNFKIGDLNNNKLLNDTLNK